MAFLLGLPASVALILLWSFAHRAVHVSDSPESAQSCDGPQRCYFISPGLCGSSWKALVRSWVLLQVCWEASGGL